MPGAWDVSTIGCPSCGARSPEGSTYCGACGDPLQQAGPPHRRRGLLVAVVAVVVVAAVATTVAVRNDEVAAIVAMPTSGGEVVLADGFRVVVPDGALSTDGELSVVRAEPPGLAMDMLWEDTSAVGGFYLVELVGAQIQAPIRLEIPFDPAKLSARGPTDFVLAGTFDEDSGEWEMLPGEVDADRSVVTVEVEHFSWFGDLLLDVDYAAEPIAHVLEEVLIGMAGTVLTREELTGIPLCRVADWPTDVRVAEFLDDDDPPAIQPCPDRVFGAGDVAVALHNIKPYPIEIVQPYPASAVLPEPFDADIREADRLFEAGMIWLAEQTPWTVYIPPGEVARGRVAVTEGAVVSLSYDASDMVLFLDMVSRVLVGRVGGQTFLDIAECGWTAFGQTDWTVFDVATDCITLFIPSMGEAFRRGLRIIETADTLVTRYLDEFSDVDTGTLTFHYLSGPDDTPEPTVAVTDDVEGLLGMTWSRVPHDAANLGGPGMQRMYAVAGTSTALVAVGRGGGFYDSDAAVWTSSDGRQWSRVPHDELVFGGPSDQAMNDVVAAGPGFVAVGEDRVDRALDAAIWVSTDGRTWERVDDDALGGPGYQAANAVATGADGLIVAVGRDDAFAPVWTSSDGATWNQIPPDQTTFDGVGALESITSTSTGFLAVGRGGDAAIVLGSVDGITWEHVASFPGGHMNVIEAGLDAFVAAGYDHSGDGFFEAAVWRSEDGIDWARVGTADPSGLGGGVIDGMTAVGRGFVALGHSSSSGIWVSEDGNEWQQVDGDQAAFSAPAHDLHDAVFGGRGLVAVGEVDDAPASSTTADEVEAAVWIGTLPAPTSPGAGALRTDGIAAADFGDDMDPSMDAIVATFGQPSSDETFQDPGGFVHGFNAHTVRYVEYDALLVWFTDSPASDDSRRMHLAGWNLFAQPDQPELMATTEGITVGSSIAAVQSAYGSVLTMHHSEEGLCGAPEWYFRLPDGLEGGLSGPPDNTDTTVTYLRRGEGAAC